MVQNFLVQILHKFCIIITIFCLLCKMIKNCRRVDCLCQGPVHAVMNHRFSFPVCGVYDTAGTIHIPGVCHCTVIQIFCCINIFFCCFRGTIIGRKCPLHNQPCPFDSMARSRSIWFKWIIRLLFVALQIRLPFFRKMLRNSPFIFFSPANDTINNSSGSFPVNFISCHISHSQKCLYCVHIGIDAPIIIKDCKFSIPSITGQPFFLVPEPKIIQLQGFFQKFFCSVSACQQS